MTDIHELTSEQKPTCCLQEEMEVSGLALYMQTKVPLLMMTIQILKCQKPSQDKGYVLTANNYLSTQLTMCSVLTQHTMTIARKKKMLWKAKLLNRGIQLLLRRVLNMHLKDTNMWCCLALCKSIDDFCQPTGCGQLGPTKFINIDNTKHRPQTKHLCF